MTQVKLETKETFHIEEYKTLRAEIQSYINSTLSLERDTAIAVAAFLGFMFTKVIQEPYQHYARYAFWLPFVFVLLNWCIFLHRRSLHKRLSKYIQLIERDYALASVKG